MLEKADKVAHEKLIEKADYRGERGDDLYKESSPLAGALSRAVLPASDTARLHGSAERAVLSSIQAQSQLS